MQFMNNREPFAKGVASSWEMKTKPQNVDQTACIGGFMIHGPFHPFWNMWSVSVVHLRDIEGGTKVNRKDPENTHEFQIVSIDSAKQENFDPHAEELKVPILMLSPPDLIHQVQLDSDIQAREILELMVKTICEKGVSPDSDLRPVWKILIDGTIEHIRSGAPCSVGATH